MEHRKGTRAYPPERLKNTVISHQSPVPSYQSRFLFHFLFSIFLVAGGCGAPGEPVPPSPTVPVAIADLAAHQSGDGIELVFTLPAKSRSGEKLTSSPAIEILRGALKPDGKPDSQSFRIVYTIPGALAGNYVAAGRVHFTDPVSPLETKAQPGTRLTYLVRTRLSPKRASADSNIVTTRAFPVPRPISQVHVQVTETAVSLDWPAPTQTSGGEPLPAAPGYHVYRGEIDPHTAAPAAKDLALMQWISPLALLGPSSANAYRDTQFDFGKTYVYVVRSVITAQESEIESDNSDPAAIAVLDTFPPAAPQGLVAVVLPGSTPQTLVVDLSWAINLETDLAGYRVYRSEQEGERGRLLMPDLLSTPAVRDDSVVAGHRCWYAVTAVDRAGNESPLSNPVVVDIAQPPS